MFFINLIYIYIYIYIYIILQPRRTIECHATMEWTLESKTWKEEQVLFWKISGQYQPYNVNRKRCLLCWNEMLQIAIYRENYMLNKKTEIISKYRHKKKCVLASYDSLDWNITSNVKLKFLEIIKNFEACRSLIYCSCEADWQKFHLFQ